MLLPFHYIKGTIFPATSYITVYINYVYQVTYSGEGWLEKNRDTLPPGVMEMLQSSSNALVMSIFRGKICDQEEITVFLNPMNHAYINIREDNITIINKSNIALI